MAIVTLGDTCIRCEYSLEGLADDGRCPECGFPVVTSRDRSALLRSADPEWVERLWRGLRDLCWPTWLLLGAFVLLLVLALVEEGFGFRNLGLTSRLGAGDVALYAVGFVALVLHIRGCVRLAAAGHPEYAVPPRIRWTLLLCGAALPVLVGLTFVLFDRLSAGPALEATFKLLAQVIFMAWFFALAAALRHYEQRTALWTPDLERRHRNVSKNLYGVILVLVLFVWVQIGRGRRVGDPGIMLFGLTYLFFTMAIARVRAAIEHEHEMAAALALAREHAPTPPAADTHS